MSEFGSDLRPKFCPNVRFWFRPLRGIVQGPDEYLWLLAQNFEVGSQFGHRQGWRYTYKSYEYGRWESWDPPNFKIHHLIETPTYRLFASEYHRSQDLKEVVAAPKAGFLHQLFLPSTRTWTQLRHVRMVAPGFRPSDWIGRGKKYIIEALPDYVTEAKGDLQVRIPAALKTTFLERMESMGL